MATRTEDRVGEATGLGTTYTSLGTVPASTTWNVLLNVTNRLTASVKLRAFVADNSWSTGEPTGGTLKFAMAYDMSIGAGETVQISGNVMKTTEKLVVRSDTAAALDIGASAVVITP